MAHEDFGPDWNNPIWESDLPDKPERRESARWTEVSEARRDRAARNWRWYCIAMALPTLGLSLALMDDNDPS